MTAQITPYNDPTLQGTENLSDPYSWTARIPREENKGPYNFDAIVVGSGIGGLTCAALLAQHSLKVLVLEKHFQVGGFCSSFKRNGFTFTSGVEDVSGLHNDGAISDLLNTLALNKDDLFILNSRLFVLGGKKIILNGTKEGTIAGLSSAFPNETTAITAFLDEASRAFHNEPEMIKKWSSVTYQQKLDEFFHNPELKAFFCSLLGYLGVTADKIPANKVLEACLSYFLVGGYYPKGGPQHFANTLRDYITAHGGRVMTKTAVNEVLVADGKVTGVKAGDHVFSSPIVVGNVNARTLFTSLIAPERINKAYIDAIAALPMSMSVCLVQVGTDLDLTGLPSHIQVLDPEARIHCVINSNADASLAPQGKSCITFLSRGVYRDTPPRGTAEYDRFKEEKAKKVLSLAESVFPTLRDHILVQDVSTPRTFERYTSMPEGAIYSFDQSKRSQRPYFKTPIQGLYLASASTNPGGGIEAVAASGMRVAQDVLGNGP